MYKIAGAWLELGQRVTTIERKTYSMLEWVGEVGGLFDGLVSISRSLITPISKFSLQASLLILTT